VNKESIQPKPLEPLKETDILITGASGFIGTHLVDRLLKDRIRLRCLVRKNSPHRERLQEREVEIFEGDLSDKDVLENACAGVRIVIHAGATLSNNWQEHQRTNIEGTANILAASVNHNVERFVFVSSLAVFDLANKKPGDAITEDDPQIPDPSGMGPYYHSKIEGERLVQQYVKDYGLAATIVRPGLVTGPGGPVFFQQIGYQINHWLFIMIGNGSNRLPLTFVENTVEGIINAAFKKTAIGKAYNLLDDKSITAEEYIKFFRRETGLKCKLIKVPYLLLYLATYAYEIGVKLGLLPRGVTSRAQLAWKQSKVEFVNHKANNELGDWQVVPLEQGLRKTFKWYATRLGGSEGES